MIISKENTRLKPACNVTAGHLFCLPTNLIMRRIYVLSCSVIFAIQAPLSSKGHFQEARQQTRLATHSMTLVVSLFYFYSDGLIISSALVGPGGSLV